MNEIIKIKLQDEYYDANREQLKLSMDVTYNFKNHYNNDMSRMQRDIISIVENKIIEIISDRYLEDFSDEVLKKIDMEAIIRRVQLNVVSRLS